ncbi:hypothetical protein CEXT_575321 [Caerostris extrusa]|uniref:Uncharacterized protein n=1 Tax=Caerostris extrusa TaxID=172846 RepID=A0AAV4W8Y1_CAEEX|nr:hypothetical protein CEXT_575321 [Caerostris extrusa]
MGLRSHSPSPIINAEHTFCASSRGTPACISREVFRDGELGNNGLLIAGELEPCLIPLTAVKLSPCWVYDLRR